MQSLRKEIALLLGLAALAAASPAEGQGRPRNTSPTRPTTTNEARARARQQPNPEEGHAAQTVADEKVNAPDRPTLSKFGTGLSDREVGALLVEMRQLAEQALATSRQAEQAQSVAEVKSAADRVLTAVWGIPSGVSGDAAREVQVPGWKERWQVTGEEFDPRWAQRYGTRPPRITDPRQLGIAGRGLAVRGRVEPLVLDTLRTPAARRQAADALFASLNNVIGWTHMTRGYKGREVQPRASLTYMWDMPPAFWNSSADTGWLYEAYSQAVNILKTNYAGDAAEARKHAAGMTQALTQVLNGMDADRNGRVEARAMEGGLNTALAQAAQAGFPAQ